jgi:NAD(P)-dependent dehydrogenase (short-subunit alcohol dehydrogenase family)
MQTLRGKTAVITGGAAGLGRAMAEAFLAEGCDRLVLADVEMPVLEATSAALRAKGATVVPVRCDVARGEEIEALAERAFGEFGRVDVLCNNAGVSTGGPLWLQTEADWRWVLGVNLWGVIHGVRVFVPRMIAQGGEGHVVNTASMAGLVAPPFMGIYNVTKQGVVALSETLHKDLALAGAEVKVSVLCPGFVRTGIAESERNRPDGSGNPVMANHPMQEMAKAAVAGGIDPALVGRAVAQAILQERFYILTHQEMLPAFKMRADEILEGRNPKPMVPPV